MDVFDTKKVKLYIFIKVFTFIPSSSCPVCHCVYLEKIIITTIIQAWCKHFVKANHWGKTTYVFTTISLDQKILKNLYFFYLTGSTFDMANHFSFASPTILQSPSVYKRLPLWNRSERTNPYTYLCSQDNKTFMMINNWVWQ